MSRKCKEPKPNNKKQIQFKTGQRIVGISPKKDIQKANEHLKGCAFAIGVMKIKTRMNTISHPLG